MLDLWKKGQRNWFESCWCFSCQPFYPCRSEGLQEVKEKAKPFDWTYTTSYKGTLSSTADVSFQVSKVPIKSLCWWRICVEVCETEKRIDYEKLKTQERIAFYNEVILFEDELADNGVAILSVKIVSSLLCILSMEIRWKKVPISVSHSIQRGGTPPSLGLSLPRISRLLRI